jgi:hypothetical protein
MKMSKYAITAKYAIGTELCHDKYINQQDGVDFQGSVVDFLTRGRGRWEDFTKIDLKKTG